MRTYIVSPAYGRDYKNRRDALDAFKSGKDFTHETSLIFGGGSYCSIRDFAPGEKIEIRYNRKQGIVIFTIPSASHPSSSQRERTAHPSPTAENG
jgi:hypothetical protein